MPIRFRNYVQIDSEGGGFDVAPLPPNGNLPQGGVTPQILQLTGDPPAPTWVYAPVDMPGAYSPGLLVADQVVFSITCKRLLSFSANAFAITLDVAPAVAKVFTLKSFLTGDVLGTVAVSIGSLVGVGSIPAFESDVGEVLRMYAPDVPDNQMAGAQVSATAFRYS